MDNADINIRYSGKTLYDIFKNNTYHGQIDISSVPVTFRVPCCQYFLPNKRVFICKGETSETSSPDKPVKVFIQHTQFRQKRYFVSSQKVQNDFNQLSNLLSADIWRPACNFETQKSFYLPYEEHFLSLTGKVYDELSYSNMIAHYLRSNKSVLISFLSQLLKLKVGFSSSWNVYREKNKIDILIETDDLSVIIENKIRSGINGINKDGSSQLSDYIAKVKEEHKSRNCSIYTFILLPDYVNLDSDLKLCNDYISIKYGNALNLQYKVIKYSELKCFFEEVAPKFANEKNFKAFIEALGFHSEIFDSYLTNLMIGRFLSKL